MLVPADTPLHELKRIAQELKRQDEERRRNPPPPPPPLTDEERAERDRRFERGKEISRKGLDWFARNFKEFQKCPAGTVIGVNVDTEKYYTAPRDWEDVENVEKQYPKENGSYWMFRLVEARDGKKYAGGIYSVGGGEAITAPQDQLRLILHYSR